MIASVWKIIRGCFFTLLFFLASNSVIAQVKVIQFNAGWNSSNDVEWCHSEKKGLSDCKVVYIDIEEDKEAQSKYKVVVVPTIILFNEGEEVKRFQADLSFKMTATREDVQEEIDELIMSDF